MKELQLNKDQINKAWALLGNGTSLETACTFTDEYAVKLLEDWEVQQKEIYSLKQESLKMMEYHKHNISVQSKEIEDLQKKNKKQQEKIDAFQWWEKELVASHDSLIAKKDEEIKYLKGKTRDSQTKHDGQ